MISLRNKWFVSQGKPKFGHTSHLIRLSFSKMKYICLAGINAPQDNTFPLAPVLGQQLFHSLKRQCDEQITLSGQIIAISVCAADSHVEPKKPSVNHPIARNLVILSSSERSTVSRLPQMMACDRHSSL